VLSLGGVVGYYLRLMIALGKRRSIEIDIKQMMVGDKEEAQRIIDEAKGKSEEKLAELREEEKNKGLELKDTEKRLIKKDELLDARQAEINKEVENIWDRKEHHMGGMDMMNEKMMEMMSKEDMMMMYGMKIDKKIAMLKVKLDYMKKMREMLKNKM